MARRSDVEATLYQPLPPGSYVRVLSLESPSTTEQTRYSLFCRPIDAGSPYLALSYRWEKDEKHPCIIVNGREVSVMQTVKDFLDIHLCKQACHEIFIDSICINQQDLDERASQVRLMGQIYCCAAKVCLWLGRDVPVKARAVLHTALNWTGNTLLPQGERFAFVAEVFIKEYWKRAWIIQEIVLAHAIELYWGEITLSEAILQKAGNIQGLMVMNPDLTEATEVLQRRRDASKGILQSSLTQLLCAYEHTQATDVRDKVYAMLSMARAESTADTIPVDYSESKTQVDVFCDVMKYCDPDPGFWCCIADIIARSLNIDVADIRASPRASSYTNYVRGWVVGVVQDPGVDVGDHQLQEIKLHPSDYPDLRGLEPDIEILALSDDLQEQSKSTPRVADTIVMSALHLYPSSDLSWPGRKCGVLSRRTLEPGDVIVASVLNAAALIILRKVPGGSYLPVGKMRSDLGWSVELETARSEEDSRWNFVDAEPCVRKLTPMTFRMNLVAIIDLCQTTGFAGVDGHKKWLRRIMDDT